MKTNPIRIVIIDDHDLVRKSWKILLENHPRFLVVAEFSTGEKAIDRIRYIHADIILADINMEPLDGLSLTENLIVLNPDLKIIGFSINNHPDFARRMLAMGAKGYLTKTSPFDEICLGIIKVWEGNIFICREIQAISV